MKPRLKYFLMLVLLSLGFIASLRPARRIGLQAEIATEMAPLQRGKLDVWVPKTFVTGLMNDPTARITNVYQWTILQNEFKRDFPDFGLHFKVRMERDEFVAAVRSSEQNPPDLAFLDNIIRDLRPLVNSATTLQMPPLAQARFSYNGSWTIFRRAKNLEAGKAFVLWLCRSPHWRPPQLSTRAMVPVDVAAVQTVSVQAVRGLDTGDSRSFLSVMDPEATHFDWHYEKLKTLSTVKPLMTFGNSRLAFVLVSAVGEDDRAFGMSHSVLILRKGEGGWRVLLFLRGSLPLLENFLQTFDRMGLREGPAEELDKPALLNPMDHARIPRWPPGRLEWTTGGTELAGYIVEWQFGQHGREDWSPSWISIIPPMPGEPSISIRSPLGIGAQPHRWRVWAIGSTGVVSISEWRTVDFTN